VITQQATTIFLIQPHPEEIAMRSGFNPATVPSHPRLSALVGIALGLLLLASCASSQPAALTQSAPKTLSLAEAQAIVQEISRATQIRWFETDTGWEEAWRAEYTITPRDYRLAGELQGRNNLTGLTVTLSLDAASEPLEAFLANVAALPIVLGPEIHRTVTDDFTRTVVELTTPQGLVFLECLELHEDCDSWNVWIASYHPSRSRWPCVSAGTHFLVSGPELRDSLGRLHQSLGVDKAREQLKARP
jgi:hypothetical protein